MKTVILAGGLGTRLSEETNVKPKPMVEIGGQPVLWHIMKHYAAHGLCDFYLALGYLGNVIKEYFLDYHLHSGDMTLNLGTGEVNYRNRKAEDWNINLIDTGQGTNTGGRILRLREHLQDGTFCVTYGDGVADIDIGALIKFHRSHGKIATLTAVRPPARFGGLIFDGDRIARFTEKPQAGEGWINGGFMVLEPEIFRFLDNDASSLEAHGMDRLAACGELMAYRHDGFWQCMDTKRDVDSLRLAWDKGKAPWKCW